MPSTLGRIWLMVILSTFFWGSNFNAGAAVATDFTPLSAAAERFAFALVLFWGLRFGWGAAESHLRLGDAGVLLALGVIGVFGFNYAFFTAMHSTSALNAALIMALSPLLSTLLSVALLKTQVQAYQYLGIAIAFLGVSLVITGGHFSLLHSTPGDAWMLLAACVWSLYSVGAKKYAGHIPSLQFARWTVSIGALALILAAFCLEQPLRSIAAASQQTHLILLYMGLCGSVLAYIYWLKGVFVLGPQQSAIAFNLVPVFTLLVNLGLGTWPNWMQLLGLVIVICGVWLTSGWKPKPAVEA